MRSCEATSNGNHEVVYYFLVAMRFWETPVHIPNTMVKTEAADNTILVTVWEGRWLPDL